MMLISGTTSAAASSLNRIVSSLCAGDHTLHDRTIHAACRAYAGAPDLTVEDRRAFYLAKADELARSYPGVDDDIETHEGEEIDDGFADVLIRSLRSAEEGAPIFNEPRLTATCYGIGARGR